MYSCVSRRCFLKTTGAGIASSGMLLACAQQLSAANALSELAPKTKIRVGKVYVGVPNPGWPMSSVDLPAEIKRYEAEMAKLPALADVEFIDGGLVSNEKELAAACEKLKPAVGILVIHLTLRTGGFIQGLLALEKPVMIFTMPYSGHEWHTIAGWQREGKLIDLLPSSKYEDIATAIRPFRAIQRLQEARVIYLSDRPADANYTAPVKERFGTEFISLQLPHLQKAYDNADRAEAEADAKRWIREAKKVVEPTKEEVLKGSLMYIAMRDLLAEHKAVAIAVNCLGSGLITRGMGYPCLGFVRFNNALLAGVCEADLKSTMTQLIFTYLVGRTGFVTDPMFDLSNNTIIHAHCVAATQMEGPNTKPSSYHIRSHLEDGKGASLQVRMPINRKVCMARLLGADQLLYAVGDAVDSPFVDRGCRSKLTMRVENPERILQNWSSGLHRVVFYGDHTRDINRYCRFMKIRLLREGIDDLQSVPGLDWAPRVHA